MATNQELAELLAPDAVSFTDWTVEKTVKEAFTLSGFLYTAVNARVSRTKTVDYVVCNEKNEELWDHPLTAILLDPNPKQYHRSIFYELLGLWQDLSGGAYLYKNKVAGTTRELWLVPPDHLKSEAKPGSVSGERVFIETKNHNKTSSFYTTENTGAIYFPNPADPYSFLTPLRAAAANVDIDVAMQKWNLGGVGNNGVYTGVLTFKSNIDENKGKSILEKLKERFTKKFGHKLPLVLGNEANYVPLSLTPQEMDFINGRAQVRNEIYSIYGVPPMLEGSESSATYNNFKESERILWHSRLIPICNDRATFFTQFFKDELPEGYYVKAVYSHIHALQSDQKETSDIAKNYYNMGVPFSQLNSKFELGFEAFPSWDLPFSGQQQGNNNTADSTRSNIFRAVNVRTLDDELKKKDRFIEGEVLKTFSRLLDEQFDLVIDAVENGQDVGAEIVTTREKWIEELTRLYVEGGLILGGNVIVEGDRSHNIPIHFRQTEEELLESLINEYLSSAGLVLTAVSEIEENTVKKILEQVQDYHSQDWTIQELREAIEDSGIFGPDRALRISRTEGGSIASTAQYTGGKAAGADTKTWNTGGSDIRSIHAARNGETVGIDSRFSQQGTGYGPLHPNDPNASAADRINCKCFLTFGLSDG